MTMTEIPDQSANLKKEIRNMSIKHVIATATIAITVAANANANAAEPKQLPVSGAWVDVCDISGVRTISPPQLPPAPPGFPAPPSLPTLIEVSLYSNSPISISIPKSEDANAIKEKISKMHDDPACKSGEKK